MQSQDKQTFVLREEQFTQFCHFASDLHTTHTCHVIFSHTQIISHHQNCKTY